MNRLSTQIDNAAVLQKELGVLNWAPEKLWENLEPLLPGLNVELLSSTPSTNTTLMERLRGSRPGELSGSLLIAEQQTQGRGRQSRIWHAERGASLTFSLALPGRLLGASGLSLVVGVALAEALSALCTDPSIFSIGVKWPNDLWLMDTCSGRGRKLGGVLIETVRMRAPDGSASSGATVIGVGLNIAPLRTSPDLSSGYACLSEVLPTLTAPAALHHIARPLVLALLELEVHGFMAFAERFAKCDLLHGSWVRTGTAQGQAQGVTSEGALRLGQPDGTVLTLHSGEVNTRTCFLRANDVQPEGMAGAAAC